MNNYGETYSVSTRVFKLSFAARPSAFGKHRAHSVKLAGSGLSRSIDYSTKELKDEDAVKGD